MDNISKLKFHTFMQIILFAFAVALDQVTKLIITTIFPEPNPSEDIVVIKGILEFTYIRNSGASFGILQNKMIIFYLITILVIGVIIFFMIRINIALRKYYKLAEFSPEIYKKKTNKGMIFMGYILCALAGGAVGNFIDRIRLGYVVDFIDLLILKTPSFKGGFHFESFPIFNIADLFVTFSAVLLFIYILFIHKDDENFHLLKEKEDNENSNLYS